MCIVVCVNVYSCVCICARAQASFHVAAYVNSLFFFFKEKEKNLHNVLNEFCHTHS